ncbi:hypothetical protein Tco_0164598 [Tanacetum coccineum]
MHRHGHPELAKKLSDKISKTIDEMCKRVRAFIMGETTADTTEVIRSPQWEKSTEGFTPLMKTPKEILAMDNVNFPPPPSMKQIEKAVASGRLAHPVKDIRKSGQKSKVSAKGKEKVISMVRSQGYRKRPYERVEHWMDNAIAFSSMPRYQLMDCPVVVDALIEGFRVQRIYVDGGEVNYPLGVIDLEVTMGECGRTRTVIMEFAVVKSPSSYNALLGKEPMQLDDVEERRQPDKGKKLPKSSVEEKIEMTKKDEEKTAFHTEKGVFHYTKMPFGLKNAGVTYLRLVDSAFKEQIGVNLEAYVDDMVIKSRTEQDIIKDIE